MSVRNLIVVFGDQLDLNAAAFDGFDADRDVVWMAEVAHESTHVWTHKQRIALFLAAMRHFRDALRERGDQVHYTQLDDAKQTDQLSQRLGIDLRALRPEQVIACRPGEWRVQQDLQEVCAENKVALEIREDRHFYTTPEDFETHAEGRKSLRMEFFYRELRKRFDVLMEANGKPVGGDWNFDKANRGSFGKSGPENPGAGPAHRADAVTQAVIDLVNARFAAHPGSLERFTWPVTRQEARRDLDKFIHERLPTFGQYQDAMWQDEPWLYHSLISSSLNLKLLNPREVVEAAEAAYHSGHAPIEAVEGFIRQILGWREYVRGIYWMHMPDYLDRNAMGATEELPDFYWTGETELECLRQSIGQTLEHGYAHHIQRLMVTGLYALLLGVQPKRVHEWYLAVYVDAVEWVELPNTLGMSQYGDGGLMASKPYVATGKYIQRMSNYCQACPMNPAKRTGADACPYTTLYWDYLLRHEEKLRQNQRMSLQVRNLDRISAKEKDAIRERAAHIRDQPNLSFALTS
jgi:deoxyribodipyrimidine photolyase-related protein